MLTEDDLRELIDSAVRHAPEPTPLPDDLFHFEAPAASRRSRRIAAPLAVAAALLVVIVAGGLAFRGHDATTKTSAVAEGQFTTVANSIGSDGANDLGVPTTIATGTEFAGGAQGGGGTGALTPAGGPADQTGRQAQVPQPTDSAKIIKNGSLELKIGTGTVTESVNQLTAIVTGLGGYVSETRSTSSSSSGAQASATISVRVPSAVFEQLLASASKLGEVRSTTTSGQDVTAQFTDIEAQLKALTATRDQFLLVLGEAKNVNDILAVQDRITQVQIQIDQLEGQKRLLTDQTSFGTLSVTLLEPGATVAVPPIDTDKDLGDAWRDARRNFGDAIENIVEASGTLAVVFLCGAALFAAGWFIYRASRRRMLTL